MICKLRSKGRVSSDHAGMNIISAEVFIFCLRTKWIHLVTCSKIEFREPYYCSRCALDKICEIFTFDPCPHGWSSQKSFLACVDAKKKKKLSENNYTIFEICILNPFHGQKINENFFPTGSREDRSWRERHSKYFFYDAFPKRMNYKKRLRWTKIIVSSSCCRAKWNDKVNWLKSVNSSRLTQVRTHFIQ